MKISVCSPGGVVGMDSGRKYSVTSNADSKIRVCIMWILMLFAKGGKLEDRTGEDCSSFRRARESSRRTDIHSVDLRLLCWNRSMSGVERRRDVYCL